MSVNLENNPRFQQEYNDWQQRISQIDNMRIKAELEQELLKLLKEVRRLDTSHKNVISKNTIPDAVNDSRDSLLKIRKKIAKTLDDYEKSLRAKQSS